MGFGVTSCDLAIGLLSISEPSFHGYVKNSFSLININSLLGQPRI